MIIQDHNNAIGIPVQCASDFVAVINSFDHTKGTQLHLLQNNLEWSHEDIQCSLQSFHGIPIDHSRVFRVSFDADLELLAPLRTLTALSIMACGHEASTWKFLAKLIRLRSLHLWCNDIGDVGVAYLKDLTQLTSLNLWNNSIGPAGAAHLQRLTRLTCLDLGYNCIGATGAASISRMKRLRSLNVEFNKMGEDGAVHLKCLTKLTCLNLAGNRIGSRTTQLNGLKELTTLELRGNNIGDQELCTLAMAHRSGKFPNLESIDLTANYIRSVDEGLLRTCEAAVIFDVALKGVVLPHARVMLVGMGDVGKSYLAARTFQRDRVLKDRRQHKVTPDIVVLRPNDCREWKPIVNAVGGAKQVEPWVWDFAGQLVTHGVHESFLADDGRTVYLLVLAADCSPGSKTKETDGNRLPYWLQLLRHTVGSTAPVIIVITRCDRVQKQRRPVDAPITWPRLANRCSLRQLWEYHRDYFSENLDLAVIDLVDEFSACDAKYPIDNGLRKNINHAIEQLGIVKDKRVHPKLETLKNLIDAEFRRRTMIHIDEFYAWCREENISKRSTQQTLLLKLHYLGALVFWGCFENDKAFSTNIAIHHSERLGARRSDDHELMTQVINPEWFKQCVYQITRKSEELHKSNPRTWLSGDEIDFVVRKATKRVTNQADLTLLEKNVIRKALEFTMVCFRQRDQYVFPRGLPKIVLTPYRDWERWELIWDFVPEYCVARLLVSLHSAGLVVSEEKNQFNHGCNAALIQYPKDSGIQALIVADPDHGKFEVRFPTEIQPKERRVVVDYVETLLCSEGMQNRPPVIKRAVVEQSHQRPLIPETASHSTPPTEFRDILQRLDGAVRRDFFSYWLMICTSGPCDPQWSQSSVHSEIVKLAHDTNAKQHWTTRHRLLNLFRESPPQGASHKVKLISGEVIGVPMVDAWRRNLNHAVEEFTGDASAIAFLERIGLGTQHGKRVRRVKPRRSPKYPNDESEISQDQDG